MKNLLLVTLAIFASVGLASAQESPRLLWKSESGRTVTAHAFSHSGKILALANDSTVRFWNVSAQRFERSLKIRTGHYEAMVYSPNDTAIFLMRRDYVYRSWGIPRDMPAEAVEAFAILRVNLLTGITVKLDSELADCKCQFAPDGIHLAVLTTRGALSMRDMNRGVTIATNSVTPKRDWPNIFTLNFSHDGSSLVAYWYGQVLIYDAPYLHTRQFVEDSLEFGTPMALGNTIFLTRDPIGSSQPPLLDLGARGLAAEQPEARAINPGDKPSYPVWSALVGGGRFLVSRYEVRTWAMGYEGGKWGLDSLLIFQNDRPGSWWGMPLSSGMMVIDLMPGDEPSLLIGNSGGLLLILDITTHHIDYISREGGSILGFSSPSHGNRCKLITCTDGIVALDAHNGRVAWAQFGMKDGTLLSPNGTTIAQPFGNDGTLMIFDVDGVGRRLDSAIGQWRSITDFLGNDNFLVSAPKDTLLVYGIPSLMLRRVIPYRRSLSVVGYVGLHSAIVRHQWWKPSDCGFPALMLSDTDQIYDFDLDTMLDLPGSKRTGLRTFAVSENEQFVAASFSNDSVEVWSGGGRKLIAAFPARHAEKIAFTHDGNRILYCGVQSGDSAIHWHDLATGADSKIAIGSGRISGFALNHDDRLLALNRGNAIEVYELPLSW